MNDKATLEAQKVALLNDKQSLESAIQDKVNHLDQLVKDIERQRGAHAYVQLLIQRLDAELSAMPPSP